MFPPYGVQPFLLSIFSWNFSFELCPGRPTALQEPNLMHLARPAGSWLTVFTVTRESILRHGNSKVWEHKLSEWRAFLFTVLSNSCLSRLSSNTKLQLDMGGKWRKTSITQVSVGISIIGGYLPWNADNQSHLWYLKSDSAVKLFCPTAKLA